MRFVGLMAVSLALGFLFAPNNTNAQDVKKLDLSAKASLDATVNHVQGHIRIVVSVTDEHGAGVIGLKVQNFQAYSYPCKQLQCSLAPLTVVKVEAHALAGTYTVLALDETPEMTNFELPGEHFLALRVFQSTRIATNIVLLAQSQAILSFITNK